MPKIAQAKALDTFKLQFFVVNLTYGIVALLLFFMVKTATAQQTPPATTQQKEKPRVTVIVIDPAEMFCMDVQKNAIEPAANSRNIKKWTTSDTEKYLKERLEDKSIPLFTDVVMTTANKSLQVIKTGDAPSWAEKLAAVTFDCTAKIKSISSKTEKKKPPSRKQQDT